MDYFLISVYSIFTLFIIGVFGVLRARNNLVLVLMSIEIMLISVILGFSVYSIYFDEISFQILVLVCIVLGGAEAAVSLAVLVVYYRLRGDLAVELMNICKG